MEKKYRLLKNIVTPTEFIVRGAIFIKTGVGKDGAYTCGNYTLHPDYVERNSMWFEEMDEPVFPKGIISIWDDRDWHCGSPDYYQMWVSNMLKDGGVITRVQNSSGEVFSVGDEVEWKDERFIINNFEISDDKIKAFTSWFNSSRSSYPIDRITKSTHKTFTKAEIEAAISKSELWTRCFRSDDVPSLSKAAFRKALGI